MSAAVCKSYLISADFSKSASNLYATNIVLLVSQNYAESNLYIKCQFRVELLRQCNSVKVGSEPSALGP